MKRTNTTRAVTASKAQIESLDNKKLHLLFFCTGIKNCKFVYFTFCLFVCLMSEAQTTEQWFLDFFYHMLQ